MFKCFAALTLSRFRCSNSRFYCGNRLRLSDITKVWLTPLSKNSQWIKPYQMHYIENGRRKSRDIFKIFDSVLVIVHNVLREKLIYVRQFRPAVYHSIITGNSLEIPKGEIDLVKFPPELGFTLEPIAGVVNKDKSLADIAREEVCEECGYDVPTDCLEFVMKLRSGVGASSSTITMFYCKVSDAQKVSQGGGIEDEVIQVVELSIDEARGLVRTGSTINSGPSTVIATLWFLCNKI